MILAGREYIVYRSGRKYFSRLNRILGFLLVSLSLALLTLNFWPVVRLELAYHFVRTPSSVIPPQVNSEIVNPVDRDFGMVIPAVNLNLPVAANVDISSESFAPFLSGGAAHALGTKLPGQGGTIFIFGHSSEFGLDPTREAAFYLLDKLQVGDEINLFYKNWRYVYRVSQKNIVKADDTSFLQNQGEEKLILQTCWPPTTQWYRLMVTARPIVT